MPDGAAELRASGTRGTVVELRLEVENRQRVHCMVTPMLSPLVDASGVTWFPETVLALLDGYLEISEAILGGRLRVSGTAEAAVRMFAAIEILLDASPHTPGMQALAARFRTERGERRGGLSAAQHRACYPFGSEAGEREMLGRLDLLPDPSSGAPR